MAYTTGQLQAFFTNANAGTAPSTAQILTLTALANQNAAGTLTDAQALAQTIDLAADITTSVGIETYSFFTGVAPSQAGIAYLNQAFVGTGIQASLNGENRFIAQSVALATQNSAAKALFTTNYGGGTIADATKAAYNVIVGNAAAAAAGINVDAAVAYLTSASSIAYYTAFVKANTALTAQADIDLAVRAAIVGEILYSATTFNNGAGVGSYATATTNLLKDLADDGNLTANSAGGINLLGSYGSSSTGNGSTGTVGSTIALTSTIDSLVGTANDDTFNAIITTANGAAAGNADLKTTLSAVDTVNGLGGVDTLNITVTDNSTGAGSGSTGAVTVPAAAVSNVENVYVRTLSATAADVTTVAAGGFSGATQFISDRSTNALTVTGLASGQAIGANGTQGAGVALTATYGATAASAVVNLMNGVIDAAGNRTTTLAVTGGGTTSLTFNSTGASNGLGAVTVAGGNVSTIAVNAGAGLTLGGITGFGAATAASTAAITVNGAGAVSLGGLAVGTGGNISTLNITTGTGTLNLGTVGATAFTTATALTGATVNVSGAAATTSTTSGAVTLGDLGANVRTINASGLTASGVNVTVGSNVATAFTGGAGTDVVTIKGGTGTTLTGAINAGAGNDIIAFTQGADIAANLTSLVSGFETLRVSAATADGAQAFDPTLLNGITAYQVATSTAGVTLNNLVAASPVAVVGDQAGLTLKLKDASGANDAVTVTLNNGATSGSPVSGVSVTSLALGGSTTTGQIETLNLVSAGRVAGATGAYNKVVIATSGGTPATYADANKYVLTGTVGLQLTTGVAQHSFTIDGSAAGPLMIDTSVAVTGTATIITGAANDTVTVGAANTANVYTGAGGDSIVLDAAVPAGAGVATINYKAAAESLFDLTGVAGASGNGGTVNAGKMDNITGFKSGQDKIDISALGVNGALTAGVVDKGTVANDAALTTLLGTAGLFSDGINTRGLAQIHYGTDTYVIVDVNKNGVFDASADLVVKLVGTASVAAGDFVTTN